MSVDITLTEALGLLRELLPIFQRHGYLLGLYGSVLYLGHGADLDVLAEPMIHCANPAHVLLALELADWAIVERYTGIMADSVVLQRGTLMLDVRFGRPRLRADH